MYLNIRSNAKYHETIHIGRINFDRWNYFSPTMPILSVPVFHHFPSCSTLATAVPVRREVKLTFFFSIATINARLVDMYITFLSLFFSSSSLPAGGATRVVVYIHKLRVGIHRSFFSSRRHYLNVKSQVKLRVPILVFIVPAGYCGAAFRLCCLPHYASSCLLRDLCVCVLPAAARSEERETERRID